MGIVIIAIPGNPQKAFINALHEKTGGKVDLVIIQKRKPQSLIKRFKSFYDSSGSSGLPKELWYAILLRLSGKTRRALEYFREYSGGDSSHTDYLPRTIEVASPNSNEVYALLEKISPKLLVMWGNAILKPHILKTAEKTINLHMGFCPYYRGAVANQFAVFRNDLERVGATIHYAEEKVDAGKILEVIAADASKSPRELFRDLNDRAHARYLEIALALWRDEYLPGEPQDISKGETFKLRHWTHEMRYKLGKKILAWEKSFI